MNCKKLRFHDFFVPVLFTCVFVCQAPALAAMTKEDMKEIRAIVKEEMAMFSHQIDKRFEQMDKRFEELRQDMNSRFNFLITVFTAMFLGTIGFALWDRRTMIRPFETKVKQIENVISLEKDERIKLTGYLKELAKTDVKLQGILQKFNIL